MLGFLIQQWSRRVWVMFMVSNVVWLGCDFCDSCRHLCGWSMRNAINKFSIKGKSISIPKRVFHLLSFWFSINDCIVATEVGSVCCDTESSFQATPLRPFCPVQLRPFDSQPVKQREDKPLVLKSEEFHLVSEVLYSGCLRAVLKVTAQKFKFTV